MFQMISNRIHLTKEISNVFINNQSQSLIMLMVNHRSKDLIIKNGPRYLSSQKISSSNQSLRKHVTSSRHAAEATFVSHPVSLNGNTDSKRELLRKNPSLPSNMILRYCPSTTKVDKTKTDVDNTSPRPLLLLFAWMLAKNGHIEKYRQFWFDRGYDVLSVQTSPLALLLPGIGGRKNAENIFDFICNHHPLYDEIVVHAFSVGGYQLCEFLNVLEQTTTNGKKKDAQERVYNSVKGMIIDSCVFAQDAAPGLSRAITTHPIVQPILQKSIENFLRLTKSFTMDRYLHVSAKLFANQRKIPGLMLYSKDDLVSSQFSNREMHEGWKVNGTISDYICWDHSLHVMHYKEHQDEYQQKVDEFCSKLNLKKAFSKN